MDSKVETSELSDDDIKDERRMFTVNFEATIQNTVKKSRLLLELGLDQKQMDEVMAIIVDAVGVLRIRRTRERKESLEINEKGEVIRDHLEESWKERLSGKNVKDVDKVLGSIHEAAILSLNQLPPSDKPYKPF